jgi:hypothetical protein
LYCYFLGRIYHTFHPKTREGTTFCGRSRITE